MTGYAQARAEQDGWAVRVSVKSVNHRFLDLKLRMPEGFDLYELPLRQIVRERIHRGHVEVTVGVELGKAAPVQVNKELVQSYLKAAEALRQETRAATDMDVVALLRLPGVITGITTSVPESEEEQERLGKLLDSGLRDALANLMVGRTTFVIAHRLATIRRADKILVLEDGQQFTKLLDGAGELGKKLDFLLQEMHREANTMLSKTPGVESEALAITGVALEIKSEIEKLREQVQNIE